MNEAGEPMFCLADVCKALDLKNPSDVKSRLFAKGVVNADTLTTGGVQSMTYINEANLYKCIFQSRKPEAEKFQDWVCEEVVPSIRKTGGYSIQPMTHIQMLAAQAQAMAELEQRQIESERQQKMLESRIERI
ncbi:MAG: hypothetical protein NC131_17805, partial [Roseburia sp.]|nr:hypothetical protein [Roseburia sp.]